MSCRWIDTALLLAGVREPPPRTSIEGGDQSMRFGHWPKRFTGASIGSGHRIKVGRPSRKDGSPNAVFSTTAGKDITKRRFSMCSVLVRHVSASDQTGFAAGGLPIRWENLLGMDVLYSGPFFTHLFSHAWLDFRGVRDEFMREKRGVIISRTPEAIAVHREYGERNPHSYGAMGGICGASPPEMVPTTGICAKTGAISASSAICREACPMGRMTAPSRPGRCSPRCPSTLPAALLEPVSCSDVPASLQSGPIL